MEKMNKVAPKGNGPVDSEKDPFGRIMNHKRNCPTEGSGKDSIGDRQLTMYCFAAESSTTGLRESRVRIRPAAGHTQRAKDVHELAYHTTATIFHDKTGADFAGMMRDVYNDSRSIKNATAMQKLAERFINKLRTKGAYHDRHGKHYNPWQRCNFDLDHRLASGQAHLGQVCVCKADEDDADKCILVKIMASRVDGATGQQTACTLEVSASRGLAAVHACREEDLGKEVGSLNIVLAQGPDTLTRPQ